LGELLRAGPAARERLGAAARERVERHFHERDMVAETVRVYRRLLGRPTRRSDRS
jgi:glycosyltransferase involved in cell wall biosynthesis